MLVELDGNSESGYMSPDTIIIEIGREINTAGKVAFLSMWSTKRLPWVRTSALRKTVRDL